MGSSEAEGSSPPAMAVTIDELKKGRQSAATLASLLLESPIAKLLLEEITSSISKAIVVLESGRSREQMDAQVDSPLSDDARSKAPGEKRKMPDTSKTDDRRRGNSWRRATSSTIEDGHTWRKYGQKVIFSAKHPRSYFRCSYMNDRGCKARRQVQKSEGDPFLYVITYFGEHTCDLAKENNPSCREPCVVSFESNEVNGIKEEIPFSSLPSHRKENEEEDVSNRTSSDSPSNCFEQSEIEQQKPSMIGLEPSWCDSLPGLNYSMTSNDLEFMDLEDILSFDQDGFFKW